MRVKMFRIVQAQDDENQKHSTWVKGKAVTKRGGMCKFSLKVENYILKAKLILCKFFYPTQKKPEVISYLIKLIKFPPKVNL